MPFKVTVIIPVYNTEKYITEAVNSASILSEVGEIEIIDNGSTDNPLALNLKLAITKPQIINIYHY